MRGNYRWIEMRIKIEACCGKGLNKKPGTILGFRVLIKIFRQRPTLPRSLPRSTIGAEKLNFRVRNGNGCVLFAIATKKTYTLSRSPPP